jgi:hypothetical protein
MLTSRSKVRKRAEHPITKEKAMTTKKTATNKKTTHHVHHATETASTLDASTNKEILMSKIDHATPTSHSSHAVAAPAETEAVTLAANAASVTPTPAPVPAAPSQAASQPKPAASKPSSAPAAGATTTGFLAPPPSPDPLFVAPTGFVPDNAMDFRGVLPRTSELIALPIAVRDLGKFADYAEVMGSKVPSIGQVQQAFDVTNQWSAARTQADAWDQYARTQEGVAWSLLRPMMARIGPAFILAVEGDPAMAAQYPGLTTLLDAKKTIAKKAVATKKANKKNVAEGKPPTHGKVGKAATKAAEKAALAEKLAAEAAANGAAAATPEPASPAAPAAPPTSAPSQPAPVAVSQVNGAAAKPS